MKHEPIEQEIESLALGALSTHDSIRIQRHIYHCGACLKRLIEITLIQEEEGRGPKPLCLPNSRKPLSFVHDTADGLIYSTVERHDRRWLARHWGEELNGAKECKTMREANEFLVASFAAMFPEHRCTERCRIDPPHKGR